MQKVSDPPPAACPACGQGPLVKAVSRTSFQLKGSGWYSDLYASPKPDAAQKADDPKPAAAAKPEPAAKAEAKPAAPAAPSGSSGSGSGGGGTPAAG
jgi:hypothetical protein